MFSSLRALAVQPLWRRWVLAALLGRLPLTMTLLALVLVGERVTGSLAVGAQLAGVATVTAGIAAPLRGRQLDRGGLRNGLRNAALVTAAVLVAQAAAVLAGVPLIVLYILAAALGAAFAALSGGFRALLIPIVAADDLQRANVVEAVLIEIAFIAGPSLAGILALLVGPVGVLLAMAAAAVTSALLIRTLPDVPGGIATGSIAPWRVPAAAPAYLLALSMGVAVGLLESALPSRATQLGMAAASAGPLLALTSAGSAVGGLVAVARRDHRHHQVRVAVALLLVFGAMALGLAATSTVLGAGLWLFALGLPIAPLNALGTLRIQDALPPSRLGEGFALYTAMILVGAGIGQSITGQLLGDFGPQTLLAGAGGLPAVAAVLVTVVVLRGRRLRAKVQTAA